MQTPIKLTYPFSSRKELTVEILTEFFKHVVETKLEKSILNKPLVINLANPLFQQALFGIEALLEINSKKSSQITLQSLFDVFEDGHQIAQDLSRLKSFFMVLTNNPLTNASFNKEKASPCSTLQENIYRLYMFEFLIGIYNDIIMQQQMPPAGYCIITGMPTNFDFYAIEYKINQAIGNEDKKVGSGPTRNWIPLLGSFGSDAQALPALSTSNIVSPLALFIFQFLPYTVSLYNSMLISYQSININFTRQVIRSNVKEYINQLRSKPLHEKIEIRGRKQEEAEIMFSFFEELENYKLEHPEEPLNLNLWLFSNAGKNPNAELIQLPDDALTWILVHVFQANHRDLMKKYLRIEQDIYHKFPDQRLISCLIQRKDYRVFYVKKHKKIEINTPLDVYMHYQNEIVGWDIHVLYQITKLMSYVYKAIDTNKINRIIKENKIRDLQTLVFQGILKGVEKQELDAKASIYFALLSPDYQTTHFNKNYMDIIKFLLMQKPEELNEMIANFPQGQSHELKNTILETASQNFLNWITLLNTITFLEIQEINNKHKNGNIRKAELDKLFRSLKNPRRALQNIFMKLTDTYPLTYNDYDILLKPKEKYLSNNSLAFILRLSLIAHYYNINWWNQKITDNELKQRAHQILGDSTLYQSQQEFQIPQKALQELHGYLQYRINKVGITRALNELQNDLRNMSYNSFKERFLDKENLTFTEYYWIQAGKQEITSNEFSWFQLRFKLRLYLKYLSFSSPEALKTRFREIKEQLVTIK